MVLLSISVRADDYYPRFETDTTVLNSEGVYDVSTGRGTGSFFGGKHAGQGANSGLPIVDGIYMGPNTKTVFKVPGENALLFQIQIQQHPSGFPMGVRSTTSRRSISKLFKMIFICPRD